jgi:hypothetical protein
MPKTVFLEELMDLRGNRTAIGYLADQLNKPDGVLPIVGSVLSYDVGIMPWRSFLKEQAALAGISDDEFAELESADPWEASEYVLSRSNRLLFMDAIVSEYGWHRFRKIEDCGAASLLPHLTRNVIVTTAIDKLLEVVFERADVPFGSVYAMQTLLQSGLPAAPELIKLSGDANRPETLVLTRSQRNEFWGLPPSFPGLDQATNGAVGYRSLLFIGYNLAAEDDPLRQMLQQKIAGGAQQIHYAIIPSEYANPQFKRVLADLNIRPIYLPRAKYWLFKPLLAYLAEQISPEFRTQFPASEPAGPAADQITVSSEALGVPHPMLAEYRLWNCQSRLRWRLRLANASSSLVPA